MKRDFQIQKQGGKEKGGFFKRLFRGRRKRVGMEKETKILWKNPTKNPEMTMETMDSKKTLWIIALPLTLDDTTKTLADQFSVFMNSKNLSKMTPHLCRKGCKHYDSVGDQKSAEFREFCWMSKDTRIERDCVCKNYEPSVATPRTPRK